MPDTSANNRRIAKNTLLLYFRMLLTMAISLYTSRVVLSTLGVEDYGIYNVVGGVVAMFSMISAPLSSSISRFLTFEMGRGDIGRLRDVFANSLAIQLSIAAVVVVVAEAVGVWFLNAHMTIAADRMVAANWVLQFSILTFAVNLIGIPCNAAIIAHERMQAFAYISIVEVSLKLAVAYLLIVSAADQLATYAALLLAVALIIVASYALYCFRHFAEFCWLPTVKRSLMRQMLGFSGWNFIGTTAGVLRNQGVNIVVNIFCGPAVNAARGIAMQVDAAVNGFVQNFMVALNPQITKSYASGDRQYMSTLVCQGARLSYYILLLLSLPIIINADYVLSLWLQEVPAHAASFLRLVLVFTLIESLSNPLITAMLATGRIRNYQIVVGGMNLLNLPLSLLFLSLGYKPECTFVISIIVSQILLLLRLLMLRKVLNLSARYFLKTVYVNVGCVSAAAAVLPLIAYHFHHTSIAAFAAQLALCVAATVVSILYVGMDANERSLCAKRAYNFMAHHIHM